MTKGKKPQNTKPFTTYIQDVFVVRSKEENGTEKEECWGWTTKYNLESELEKIATNILNTCSEKRDTLVKKGYVVDDPKLEKTVKNNLPAFIITFGGSKGWVYNDKPKKFVVYTEKFNRID